MQTLSQALAKQIRFLQQKKFREKENLFLVEGLKPVLELLISNWNVRFLLGSEGFFKKYNPEIQQFETKSFLVDEKNLQSLGTLETNRDVMAVVEMPETKRTPEEKLPLWLVLDGISDPGNLGTIIRLADWFGLHEIITTGQTVEWFNPKVVNASKGSFLRVKQVKASQEFVLASGRKILLADMNGQSLYSFKTPAQPMVFVVGQESHGVSSIWKNGLCEALTIPKFGEAESLNAAMATGILLNHWRFLSRA